VSSQNFIIKGTVYPFDVMVSVDETDEQLMKQMKKAGIKKSLCKSVMEFEFLGRGRCTQLETGQLIIRLRKDEDRIKTLGVVAHEIFHAVTMLMDRIGMKLEVMVSDESYAYLTQFYTEEIYRRIKI
jgi:hypothetical protein